MLLGGYEYFSLNNYTQNHFDSIFILIFLVLFCRINFQRIMPKANIFKSSEVFKQLNEEAMKTRADKEKEVKRWTTFLQKPNRPIPKPKSQIDMPYQEPYRVRIVKQPKPACDPTHVHTASITSDSSSHTTDYQSIEINNHIVCDASVEETTDQFVSETITKTVETIDVDDDDVPDLLQNENHDEINECEIDENSNSAEGITEPLLNDGSNENGTATENEDNGVENSQFDNNFDPVLEKQLADVQQQLQALSHLPTTIQTTLETITKQIAEIMPAFKIRTSVDITGNINEESTIKLTEEFNAQHANGNNENHSSEIDENNVTTTDVINNDMTFKEESHATLEISTNSHEIINGSEEIETETVSTKTKIDMTDVLASNVEEQVTRLKIEKCFEKQEEQWMREKEKKDVYTHELDKLFSD